MHEHLKTATFLTKLLDERFKIGKFKFGFDPILGLIPGFGNVFTVILSFYIVWIGLKMELPEKKIAEMVRNVVVDFILGVIPGVGNVADFFFKANTANLKILNEHSSSVTEGEVIDAH